MQRVEVEGVVLNMSTRSPVVILRGRKAEVLPIVVGLFEAQAILLCLQKTKFARPLTHDLIACIVKNLSCKVIRLEIHSLRQNVYFADLIVQIGQEIKRIDCRPSDGIALVLRTKSPIFVSEDLLGNEEVISYYKGKNFLKSHQFEQPIDHNEAEDFRKVLEQISAKEFWQKLKED